MKRCALWQQILFLYVAIILQGCPKLPRSNHPPKIHKIQSDSSSSSSWRFEESSGDDLKFMDVPSGKTVEEVLLIAKKRLCQDGATCEIDKILRDPKTGEALTIAFKIVQPRRMYTWRFVSTDSLILAEVVANRNLKAADLLEELRHEFCSELESCSIVSVLENPATKSFSVKVEITKSLDNAASKRPLHPPRKFQILQNELIIWKFVSNDKVLWTLVTERDEEAQLVFERSRRILCQEHLDCEIESISQDDKMKICIVRIQGAKDASDLKNLDEISENNNNSLNDPRRNFYGVVCLTNYPTITNSAFQITPRQLLPDISAPVSRPMQLRFPKGFPVDNIWKTLSSKLDIFEHWKPVYLTCLLIKNHNLVVTFIYDRVHPPALVVHVQTQDFRLFSASFSKVPTFAKIWDLVLVELEDHTTQRVWPQLELVQHEKNEITITAELGERPVTSDGPVTVLFTGELNCEIKLEISKSLYEIYKLIAKEVDADLYISAITPLKNGIDIEVAVKRGTLLS